jgi:beta-lactamase regulating signal transducer with metallopeptidase domain
MSIERLMQPGLWQLAQLTVAIAGASLVTRLFCRRRPHLAYVLWLLVLVKSLMPPIWSSHLGLFSWAAAQPKIAPLMLYRDDVIVPATTPLTIHPSVVVSGHDWARLLIIAWIGGGAALLLMTVVRSWRLRRRIEQSSVAPSSRFKNWHDRWARSWGYIEASACACATIRSARPCSECFGRSS